MSQWPWFYIISSVRRLHSVAMCQPSKKILFVCIGNSCRSPMAESVMRDLAEKNKLDWEVDSAALRPWNVGYGPEERCIKVLFENGLSSSHLGRELVEDDYHKFDYIFGMDESNIKELTERKPPGSKANVELLGTYNPSEEDRIISDPYFDNGIHGFRRCFIQISASCKNFLQHQLEKIK